MTHTRRPLRESAGRRDRSHPGDQWGWSVGGIRRKPSANHRTSLLLKPSTFQQHSRSLVHFREMCVFLHAHLTNLFYKSASWLLFFLSWLETRKKQQHGLVRMRYLCIVKGSCLTETRGRGEQIFFSFQKERAAGNREHFSGLRWIAIGLADSLVSDVDFPLFSSREIIFSSPSIVFSLTFTIWTAALIKCNFVTALHLRCFNIQS